MEKYWSDGSAREKPTGLASALLGLSEAWGLRDARWPGQEKPNNSARFCLFDVRAPLPDEQGRPESPPVSAVWSPALLLRPKACAASARHSPH